MLLSPTCPSPPSLGPPTQIVEALALCERAQLLGLSDAGHHQRRKHLVSANQRDDLLRDHRGAKKAANSNNNRNKRLVLDAGQMGRKAYTIYCT